MYICCACERRRLRFSGRSAVQNNKIACAVGQVTAEHKPGNQVLFAAVLGKSHRRGFRVIGKFALAKQGPRLNSGGQAGTGAQLECCGR